MNQKFTDNGTQKNCFDNPSQWGIADCVGRAVAPNNLGEVVSVAGVHTSACVILKNPTASNKAIRCWGPETNPIYPDINNPIQLSHGDRQSCALTVTGEVKCWEINVNKEGYTNHVAPSGLVASAVSSGGRMSCAIKKYDASVVCFGDVIKTPPAGLKAKRIEVGGWAGDNSPVHACAIDLDDNVVCWGDGAGVNVPAGLKAQSITSAEKWSCAVTLNGTAQCWGAFTNAPAGNDFIEVFAQRDAGVLIKADASVVQFKDYGTNKRINMPENLKVRLNN